MMSDFGVFVFSFNRGLYLRHCIDSVVKCAPGLEIIIIDDNSTDDETRLILDELSVHYSVYRNKNEYYFEQKTGGLSGSMNFAMEIAREKRLSYTIFIQDDMQFVRKLDNSFTDQCKEYFDNVKFSIQLSTTFVRRLSADTFWDDYVIDENAHAYIRRFERERGKSNFSDTGVFSVDRFNSIFGQFDIGEGANSLKARKLGLVCGRAIYPNMCWLPYPTSYRGKRRSIRHRLFEKLGKSGFYEIDIMSMEESRLFCERAPNKIPIMEEYLRAPAAPRQDIWSTGGGEYNFTCYGGLFAWGYGVARRAKKRMFG